MGRMGNPAEILIKAYPITRRHVKLYCACKLKGRLAPVVRHSLPASGVYPGEQLLLGAVGPSE